MLARISQTKFVYGQCGMNSKPIKDVLKELMGDMSANELSRQTDIPQPTITRILNGNEPELKTLRKLSTHYGISVTKFIGEEEIDFKSILTNEEKEMLKLFKKSDLRGKRIMLAVARAAAGKNDAGIVNKNRAESDPPPELDLRGLIENARRRAKKTN